MTTCPTSQPMDTFTVRPFNLQTLLVWERHKPKHLRSYQVFWTFNIHGASASDTFLPIGDTPTIFGEKQ